MCPSIFLRRIDQQELKVLRERPSAVSEPCLCVSKKDQAKRVSEIGSARVSGVGAVGALVATLDDVVDSGRRMAREDWIGSGRMDWIGQGGLRELD